jgi:hypothetical protein
MATRKVIGRIEQLEEHLGIGKEAPAPLTIEVVFISTDGETTPGPIVTMNPGSGRLWRTGKSRWRQLTRSSAD